MFFLFIIILLLILWNFRSYMLPKIESTNYTIIKSEKDYEIRSYPLHIIAQVTVQENYKEATNMGFRILAGYIFGNNRKKESIAMTSPVTSQESRQEKIAMTSPVVVSLKEDKTYKISFGMPAKYNMEILPIPNDSRIQILEIPTQKMAAIVFSGIRNENNIQEKKKQLLESLSSDEVVVIGEPAYAGYNPPFTPPWMTRNEILVEIS